VQREEAARLLIDASTLLDALRTQAGIDMGKALPTYRAWEKALAAFHKACADYADSNEG
jgi:hypothetical protein